MSDLIKKAAAYSQIAKTSHCGNSRRSAAFRLGCIFSKISRQQVHLLYGKTITTKIYNEKSSLDDSYSEAKVKVTGLTNKDIESFKTKNKEMDEVISLIEQVSLFGNYADARQIAMEALIPTGRSRKYSCLRNIYLDSNFDDTSKHAERLFSRLILDSTSSDHFYVGNDVTLRSINEILSLSDNISGYRIMLIELRKVARHGTEKTAKSAIDKLGELKDYEGLAVAIVRSENIEVRKYAAEILISLIFKSVPKVLEFNDASTKNGIEWLRYASLRNRDSCILLNYIAPALAKLEDQEGLLLMAAHAKAARTHVLEDITPKHLKDVEFLKRLISISNFEDSAESAMSMLVTELVNSKGAQEALKAINSIKRPSPEAMPLISKLKEQFTQEAKKE